MNRNQAPWAAVRAASPVAVLAVILGAGTAAMDLFSGAVGVCVATTVVVVGVGLVVVFTTVRADEEANERLSAAWLARLAAQAEQNEREGRAERAARRGRSVRTGSRIGGTA